MRDAQAAVLVATACFRPRKQRQRLPEPSEDRLLNQIARSVVASLVTRPNLSKTNIGVTHWRRRPDTDMKQL
jgi:hypothetical protein